MVSLNKVSLIGHLGKDPEIRYIPNGNAVANLSLATSETWVNKQTGEIQKNTEWHKIVIYGKLAEISGEYARKGTLIYVEGQLKTRSWTDNLDTVRYTTEIVINRNGRFQVLERNFGSNQSAPEQETPIFYEAESDTGTGKIKAKGKGTSKKAKSNPVLAPVPQGQDFPLIESDPPF
ncbi:single-stranded DNA-binding protein [Xenorhabdus sp. SGI246]|uniref:single-stranded DNA-binding protein n=1 Tax=Xenorhabdus sp. SGI246 TaxID=3158263 RepID=UPI00349F22FF